jgi:hypothetical protein
VRPARRSAQAVGAWIGISRAKKQDGDSEMYEVKCFTAPPPGGSAMTIRSSKPAAVGPTKRGKSDASTRAGEVTTGRSAESAW